MHTRLCRVFPRVHRSPAYLKARGLKGQTGVYKCTRTRGGQHLLSMHVVAVHARDELTPPIDSSMKTIGLFAASI
jgi:hypothetical protein